MKASLESPLSRSAEETSLEYETVVRGRRSIRGFKPEPVPKSLIREVIELAMRAPSSLNTQPWNFYVVTGEPLDRIRRRAGLSRVPRPWRVQGRA